MNPDLENRLQSLLERLHLAPALTPSSFASLKGNKITVRNEETLQVKHNMILNYRIADFEPRPRQSAQLISWCPPLENWNPWTACNIDEGPEVRISLCVFIFDHRIFQLWITLWLRILKRNFT